jgi:hypothetical protein
MNTGKQNILPRNKCSIAVQPQMSPPHADDANQKPLQSWAVANHNPEARKRSYEVTSN